MRLLLVVWLSLVTSIATAETATPTAPPELNECTFPEQPAVPNGLDATKDQMAAAGKDIKGYVASMQASLACIDNVQENLDGETGGEQRTLLTKQYNNGVDQLNEVASNYNEQVRAFKAK